MAASEGEKIVERLLAIERRSREHARGLPEQVEVKSTWAGIGFRVGSLQLVAPLGVIREILTFPTLCPVPGAKSWMKGIANVRGNLLPVTDLNGFLQGQPTPARRQTRVLVVQNGPIGAGLLVDEVLGLRHFFQEEFSADVSAVPEYIRPFADGVYRQGSAVWANANLHSLIESEPFMQVAA